MNILKSAIIGLLLPTGLAFAADSPAIAPANPTDPLSHLLPTLQERYIDFASLNVKPGESLEQVVDRSGGGLEFQALDKASGADPNAIHILTALLPDNDIYCRLASFTPKTTLNDLTKELEQWISQGSPGVILDLRDNDCADDQDYVTAAQIAALIDQNPLLFSAKGFSSAFDTWHDTVVTPDAKVQGKFYQAGKGRPADIFVQKIRPLLLPVVLLVNGKTSGAGEAMAATMQMSGALVIGHATAGRAGVYFRQGVSDTQQISYVTAKIYLPDGTLLWGHPVVPDIALTVDDHNEKAALTLIKDNQIDEVIQELPARHRLSEATLVQGQDPEWDDYLSSLEQKPFLLSLPVIHDPVLITALDSLKAIQLSQRTPPAQVQADASPPATSSIQ